MKDHIIEFEEGKLGLDQLINALYGLLKSLQTTEEEWIDKFQSEWWTLEQVYAVALDRKETTLNSDSQNLVYETLENMKTLLKDLKI
ncbi:hypothetical protein WJM97_11500 [Okeanomitos corallinicola TIOX110]|uniref:Uncharacterized protein n=1 Tax=Okeanomitos corallinicola TIOX110 TaxID=3133117 RepID=A0ABZ2URH9_9CYAN